MRGLVLVVIGSLITPLAAADAAGRSSAGIIKGLHGLRWGASVAEVRKALRKELGKKFRKALAKADDVMTRRKIKKQMERDFGRLASAYTRFDGKTTGLEVSIVGAEFRHRSGESVLTLRGKKADRYFFFIGGRLWQVFVAYNRSHIKGTSFAKFLEAVERKYGKPYKMVKDMVGKPGKEKKILGGARWHDGESHLEARDRSRFFQSYTLSFADRKVFERLSKVHQKATRRSDNDADALIEMATGASAPPIPAGMLDKKKLKPRRRKVAAPSVDIF